MGRRRRKGEGVGDCLHKILEGWGFKERKACKCKKYRMWMNGNGIKWCEENKWVCVEWLRCSAEERRLPFSKWIAVWLVMQAIGRARRLEKLNDEKTAKKADRAGKKAGDVRGPEPGDDGVRKMSESELARATGVGIEALRRRRIRRMG